MLRRESAAALDDGRCASSSRPPVATTHPHRSSSKSPHATPLRPRRPLRASARACRSRPKSAGRASPRSSAALRRCSQPSSTTVLGRRTQAESLLTGGGRDALLALRGAAQRLGVRHESAERLLGELQRDLAAASRTPSGPTPAELGRAADEADRDARAAAREHEDLAARVTMARERLTALEQSLAEREGLPPAARALAEAGEQLALQLLDVAPGHERSVAAALSHRASAIVADSPGPRARARRQRDVVGARLVARARRPRSAAARRPAGRRARRAARLAGAGRHRRRHRLGSAAG